MIYRCPRCLRERFATNHRTKFCARCNREMRERGIPIVWNRTFNQNETESDDR